MLRRTGAGVTQQSVGPKLRWLQRHEPGRLGAHGAHRGVVRLARRRLADAEFSERNWALESGLYDLGDDDYAPDLCAAAGIDEGACSGRSATPAR